jgi:hypothetical protein
VRVLRARRIVWRLLSHPSKLARFPFLEGHPCWSTCGRRTRSFLGRAFREHRINVGVLPSPSSCTFREQEGGREGWGLIDLPLRASNECWFIWSISSIWFVWLIGREVHPEEPDRPERPANQTDKPGRVPRAQKIIRPPPLLFREQTTGMDVAHVTPFQSLIRLH